MNITFPIERALKILKDASQKIDLLPIPRSYYHNYLSSAIDTLTTKLNSLTVLGVDMVIFEFSEIDLLLTCFGNEFEV